MSCFNLYNIGLTVAAYPISKLIKKLNALQFFLFLGGIQMFPPTSWEDVRVLPFLPLRKGGLVFLKFWFVGHHVYCEGTRKERLRRS